MTFWYAFHFILQVMSSYVKEKKKQTPALPKAWCVFQTRNMHQYDCIQFRSYFAVVIMWLPALVLNPLRPYLPHPTKSIKLHLLLSWWFQSTHELQLLPTPCCCIVFSTEKIRKVVFCWTVLHWEREHNYVELGFLTASKTLARCLRKENEKVLFEINAYVPLGVEVCCLSSFM